MNKNELKKLAYELERASVQETRPEDLMPAKTQVEKTLRNWAWYSLTEDRINYTKEDLQAAYPYLTEDEVSELYNILHSAEGNKFDPIMESYLQKFPKLYEHLNNRTILRGLEEGEYIGTASDGTEVGLGSLGQEVRLEGYLEEYSNPEDW